MKVFVLLIVFCLHVPFCFAQFEKGKAAVGFDVGFSYDNENGDNDFYAKRKYHAFGGDLNGELFVHRNLSVIAGVGINKYYHYSLRSTLDSSNNRYSFEETTKNRTIDFIAGIRKYYLTNGGAFGFFIMPYAIVSFTNNQFQYKVTTPSSQRIEERKNDYWSPYFNTDIGVCYFIKPNFSLELSTNIVQAYADKNRQYVYLLRDLTSLRYGMRYYF